MVSAALNSAKQQVLAGNGEDQLHHGDTKSVKQQSDAGKVKRESLKKSNPPVPFEGSSRNIKSNSMNSGPLAGASSGQTNHQILRKSYVSGAGATESAKSFSASRQPKTTTVGSTAAHPAKQKPVLLVKKPSSK